MIVVHIPIDGSTSGYARYSFDSMYRLVSKPVRDNEGELQVKYHPCPSWPKMASDNHNSALRDAFKDTESAPDALHIICDSDTVTVLPDWDLVIRQQLETYDCVGATFQRIGTHQTGHGMKQTYKGKPNAQWLALKPGTPWHLFEPAKTSKPDAVLANTPEAQELWGLPWGYELLTDAFWNFPLFLQEHNVKSLAMENIADMDRIVALKGICAHAGYYEEWHLDGVPFVVHQGKSRKTPFRSGGFSAEFYKRCDQILGIGG